jgi:signal transduction histidine kinase
MFRNIPLRTRIYLILASLLAINLAGGLGMVWYTYRIQGLLAAIVDRSMVGYQVAEELEKALVNQKGFVSYYFLDGDPDWLRQLGEYRQIFRERLNQALAMAQSAEERRALTDIERAYGAYIDLKDRVIAHYKAGERSEGTARHQEVRQRFFNLIGRTEAYRAIHSGRIAAVRNASLQEDEQLRVMAIFGLLSGFFLLALLALVLIQQVLGPVRRLAQRATGEGDAGIFANEVKALSQRVDGLIQDVDHTQHELARSREHLLQAEKMALVGKLAAGMAHSIRNPFTSVKMRLFSLGRSLALNRTQQEDFQVISDEIRHIDTIVQNFLEFSRPPKLTIQPVSPSQVVDVAVQLLEHRLKAYDVQVGIERSQPLPEVLADPEQLKEVLVNLIVNACEAMGRGGAIRIREVLRTQPAAGFRGRTDPTGAPAAAEIHVSDNGPGIPEEIRDKVLQPFFTTKEEGTGLGLSIASRIMEEHGGRLELAAAQTGGATFVVTLPVPEKPRERHPDHR